MKTNKLLTMFCCAVIIFSFLALASSNISIMPFESQEVASQEVNSITNNTEFICNNIDIEDNTFNVKKYGAVGNGIVDDTSAIQDAVNDCVAHGGGCVYIPDGEYYIETVIVNSGNVSITGAGEEATIIRTNSSNYAFKFIGTSSALIFNVSIRNLSIRSVTENSQVKYIGWLYVGSGRIQNIHLQNYSKGFTGIYISNSYQTFIVNVEETNLSNGLVIENFANDIYISNSRFDGNTEYGLNINNCHGLFVDNVTCYGNTQATKIVNSENVIATNFICDTSKMENLKLESNNRVRFSNSWFGENHSTADAIKYNNVNVNKCHSVAFDSCIVVQGAKCGIYISESEYVNVGDCLFEDNDWINQSNYALTLTYSSHAVLSNNIFKRSSGHQPCGIRTYGNTTDYYIIIGNEITATTPLSDEAFGTHKQIGFNIGT